MAKNRFANLFYALIFNLTIITFFVIANWSDPKGISSGIVIFLLGIAALLTGALSLVFKVRRESFIYCWSGLTGLVNFARLFLTIRNIIDFDSEPSDSFGFWNLVVLYGAFQSVYMLVKIFESEKKV